RRPRGAGLARGGADHAPSADAARCRADKQAPGLRRRARRRAGARDGRTREDGHLVPGASGVPGAAAIGRAAVGAAGRRARLVRRGLAGGIRALRSERPVHLAVRHAARSVRPPRVDRASGGRRRALLCVATRRVAGLVGREAGRPALCGGIRRGRRAPRRVRPYLYQGRAISARRRGTSCSTRRQTARGSRLTPSPLTQDWSFVTRLCAWPTWARGAFAARRTFLSDVRLASDQASSRWATR